MGKNLSPDIYSLNSFIYLKKMPAQIEVPAQSAWVVEYTTTSLQDPPNDCSRYDTKPSDGEGPVLDLWGM